ncbi:hypothetical protein BGW80DRAFT_1475673, partial [Lactifluus volemus]
MDFLLEIVRENPKTKTIHFGGIKGQAIRERYMEMTYDTIDRAGNIKTPVVRRYKPLLFATQFAQIALVIMSRAAFEDMRSKGFVQPDAAFAGHSLGEFSALASCAVERDEPSRSNYAMFSQTFDDATLREVVDTISNFRDCISTSRCGQQYVCAGEFVALQTLTNVLNYLKVQKVDITKLTEKFGLAKVKDMLKDIVNNCYDYALEKQKTEGYIVLERDLATIPLAGIDVPFHSRYLWSGVIPFRANLSKKIPSTLLDPSLLEGVYIPNLIASPFAINKAYAELTCNRTSS